MSHSVVIWQDLHLQIDSDGGSIFLVFLAFRKPAKVSMARSFN
jgi:hypothetical protein